MSIELVKMEKMVSEMSVITKIIEHEIKNIQGDINYLKVENKDLQIEIKEVKSKISTTEENSRLALEKVTLRNSNEFGDDWLTQKDLGLMFEPSLTSHQVGKMLRKIDLAMKKRSKTTPTQKSIANGYVRRSVKENFTSWRWYSPKVKNDIIKYLNKKNVYDTFINISNQEELSNFLLTL